MSVRSIPIIEKCSQLSSHMIYVDQILHTYVYQHCLTEGMRNSLFDGLGFAEHQPGQSGSFRENPPNF